MSNINVGRVLLGGFVTGVVLNIGETVLNVVVLAKQSREMAIQHNFPPDPPMSAVGVAIAMTFVMGVLLVLGYACIRPRFGPGPKTAIIAALFAWFAVYLYAGLISSVFMGVPGGTIVLMLVWGIVQYCLAALAGAALYKEN